MEQTCPINHVDSLGNKKHDSATTGRTIIFIIKDLRLSVAFVFLERDTYITFFIYPLATNFQFLHYIYTITNRIHHYLLRSSYKI